MKYRVKASSVNVRTKSDLTGGVVGTLRKGAEFIADELTSDKRWAHSIPGLASLSGWVCIYDSRRQYCELVPEPAGTPAPIPPVDRLADIERRLERLEDIVFARAHGPDSSTVVNDPVSFSAGTVTMGEGWGARKDCIELAMTKSREFYGMSIIAVICPHCGVECHPLAYSDDYARIECGYCGRWFELWRIAGRTTVGKA